MKNIRTSRAFTLIEMLIVVAIIGILVGIGVPALGDARRKAQAQKAKTVISNLSTAKARFELDHNNGEIAAFNTSDDNGTAGKFASLAPYLLVDGATPTDANQLIAGTGHDGHPEDLTIGAIAVNGVNGVAPFFNDNTY